MKYAITYSSQTGNTKQLAQAVRQALPPDDCIYFGAPDAAALSADLLYVGFWTDKGTCDAAAAAFLRQVTAQKVFLFGTAGFGGAPEYFEKILAKATENLNGKTPAGSFMCQGKMPLTVRARYEKMRENHVPDADMLLANFDHALTHPDAADFAALKEAVQNSICGIN